MKLFVFALVSISCSAFAGSKDLKTLNTLLNIGVQSEQFMAQLHVGIDDVECAYSRVSQRTSCSLIDLSANEGQGSALNLSGKRAAKLLALLVANGAPMDQGMGKLFATAKSIRCTQSVSGVADGTAAQRSSCSFEF